MPRTFVCESCGSDDVLKDAYAEWDLLKQAWVLSAVFDHTICNTCDGETNVIEAEVTLGNPAVPLVHITTPFADIEVPISELDAYQRNALAELLGLRSAKAEAFKKLAELKPFQKIKKSDLQKQCPHKVSIDLMKVELTPQEEQSAVAHIKELIPEATCSPMLHELSMFCEACCKHYSLSKRSVLVRTVVAGVPFNKLYEV